MKVYITQIGMMIRFGKHWYEDKCPSLQAEALGDNFPTVVYEAEKYESDERTDCTRIKPKSCNDN